LLVVAPERPAVDKLRAQEVLVPDIKAAEDLNLGPVSTPSAALVAQAPLHSSHQPSDLTPTQLIVFPIGRRKAKARKPVAAIVVQVMGYFIPEVFQDLMFSDVIGVCLGRLGGPNLFAQGCKPIMISMVVTAMQTMSHPVRSLCPPPDIALKCIC
jgi:small ligand-binding sensory domain FIST